MSYFYTPKNVTKLTIFGRFQGVQKCDIKLFKSSHLGCSVKKVFLNLCRFHGKTPVFESLLNKVAGLQALTLSKKGSCTRVFLRNLRNS